LPRVLQPLQSMIHGLGKSFWAGSRCHLGKMASDEMSDEPCVVRSYDAGKQRWAVKLSHPRFGGRVVLVKEEKLAFDSFVIDPGDMLAVPHNVAVEEWGSCGKALVSNVPLHGGDEVFQEDPFMAVKNSGDAFMSRWNVYFWTKHSQGDGSPAFVAFQELSDGGVAEQYVPDATNMFKEILENNGRVDLLKNPAFKKQSEGEIAKIASVLARWQTNGHAASDAMDDASLLFRFASKMLHSCEPNCARMVCARSGRMIVRAKCDIPQGESLTIDYMGGSLSGLSVAERRERLRLRGFTCSCPLCVAQSQKDYGGADAMSPLDAAEDETSGPSGLFACSACRQPLPRTAFSKKQLQKRDRRKCAACILCQDE